MKIKIIKILILLNKHEMNFIPNKHELYLFNSGISGGGRERKREKERERKRERK